MKILITGSNGLLGQKLVELISGKPEHELIATSRGANRLKSASEYTYSSMDILDHKEVQKVIQSYQPEVVIHTAAMTNVDQCENDHEGCWALNVTATKSVIQACHTVDARLVHVSTDFIFDGNEGPLTEEASPAPVNYYGESKLAAEQLVKDSNLHWSIARTILVYGIAQDMSRSNIILWVKKNLEAGQSIHVVNDQWRTPTLAEDLAMGCYLMATQKAQGIYNISGYDLLTPYEMALKTADFFELDKSLINETDGTKFKQDAKRPPRTGFIIDKAIKDLGYNPRSFLEGIEVMARQM